MSYLINPPPPPRDPLDYQYNFNNDVFEALKTLQYMRNPSLIINPHFLALGRNRLTAVTQAAGNDADVSAGWQIKGASNATYTITPTTHASNSPIRTASNYYLRVVVSAHNGNAFYLYQRLLGRVRQFQQEYFSYGLLIKNNQNKSVKLRFDIYNFYAPSNALTMGQPFWVKPGQSFISGKLLTPTLKGITVGASNYIEFRLNFVDLKNGTADLEIYQLKCEAGKVSTPL